MIRNELKWTQTDVGFSLTSIGVPIIIKKNLELDKIYTSNTKICTYFVSMLNFRVPMIESFKEKVHPVVIYSNYQFLKVFFNHYIACMYSQFIHVSLILLGRYHISIFFFFLFKTTLCISRWERNFKKKIKKNKFMLYGL